jgi:hypothetical protein
MQNKLTLLFLTSTVILGIVCFAQWRGASEQKTQLIQLQKDAEATAEKLAKQETTLTRLKQQRADLSKDLQESALTTETVKVIAQTNAALAATLEAERQEEKSKPGMGDFLSKMMDNPEMKKMIREQQKVALKMIYGDLFKDLNLSDEEKTKLSDILTDKQMKAMEKGSEFLKNGDDVDKEAMGKEFAAQQKATDAEIKALLGDDRFKQFEDYNKNIGNKMAVNQFKGQLADGKNALGDDQAKQLMLVMREESEAVSTKEGLGNDGQAKAMQDWKNLVSDDDMNKLFARQEEINQRVLSRVPTFMSQEQIDAFASFQTNQIALQKMSLQMARQMMGAKPKTASTAAK